MIGFNQFLYSGKCLMTKFSKVVIFYFTGTGNALMVGHWLRQTALDRGLEVSLYNIAKVDLAALDLSDPQALLVVISPVHGFNYPPVVLHFLRHFPKGSNAVLLMNTRAGMLIGRWVTPGLTGIAFYHAALRLRLKGYHLSGMIPVDMPSNWISVHPGLNKPTVKEIHRQMEVKTAKRFQKVLDGSRCFVALRELIQDLLIAPVSLGYYFIGRFLFAKTYIASADCDNCGICISGCPVKAIIKVDERPFWTFRCESCMKCMSNCPQKAIETAHGSTIVIALFFSLLVLTAFWELTGNLLGEINNGLVRLTVESALFLPLLALWYRVIHYLMRFHWIERMVVYSSLTKYGFWGRRYRAFDKQYKQTGTES